MKKTLNLTAIFTLLLLVSLVSCSKTQEEKTQPTIKNEIKLTVEQNATANSQLITLNKIRKEGLMSANFKKISYEELNNLNLVKGKISADFFTNKEIYYDGKNFLISKTIINNPNQRSTYIYPVPGGYEAQFNVFCSQSICAGSIEDAMINTGMLVFSDACNYDPSNILSVYGKVMANSNFDIMISDNAVIYEIGEDYVKVDGIVTLAADTQSKIQTVITGNYEDPADWCKAIPQ